MTRQTAAIALSLFLLSGCARTPPPASAAKDADVADARPAVTFALAEPRATSRVEAAPGHPLRLLRWGVKYRMTGQPDPEEWFAFRATFGNGAVSLVEKQGQDLAPEGEVEGTLPLVIGIPGDVEIEALRGRGKKKGAYRNEPVGGPVRCDVDGAPPNAPRKAPAPPAERAPPPGAPKPPI